MTISPNSSQILADATYLQAAAAVDPVQFVGECDTIIGVGADASSEKMFIRNPDGSFGHITLSFADLHADDCAGWNLPNYGMKIETDGSFSIDGNRLIVKHGEVETSLECHWLPELKRQFDDPQQTYSLVRTSLASHLLRETQGFERVVPIKTTAPEWIIPDLGLAEYFMGSDFVGVQPHPTQTKRAIFQSDAQEAKVFFVASQIYGSHSLENNPEMMPPFVALRLAAAMVLDGVLPGTSEYAGKLEEARQLVKGPPIESGAKALIEFSPRLTSGFDRSKEEAEAEDIPVAEKVWASCTRKSPWQPSSRTSRPLHIF